MKTLKEKIIEQLWGYGIPENRRIHITEIILQLVREEIEKMNVIEDLDTTGTDNPKIEPTSPIGDIKAFHT